ncbi:putative Carboxymethylenebutenolidase [Sorangium cellulosum So ce56]|uniref:Carboxymethylenebutenolidase n=1 Tax=Sorangium cellulosum (strain So ce56) TaxID=448385 RepID=A9GLC6_SORC5|nr:dienelactone hydrolase family protein [Sorangium cellulosum]CAN90255.1 putative Carboxymethylenebutenolidase [Sorangium cellulosum So ce56]
MTASTPIAESNAPKPIHTDDAGLIAGAITLPAPAGDLPGYRAHPASGGPFPLVLVIQEIFGVHEHIRDVVRRFAHRGYYALAPDLFVRQGDPSHLRTVDELRALAGRVPDRQVLSDLDAGVAFAEASGKADVRKAAAVGFCWGGRITWLYAAHNPALKAAVAWYGRLTGDRTEAQPKHPIDVASALQAPVLGLYAGQDQGIPLPTVTALQEALRSASQTGSAPGAAHSEIRVYPDVPHAFYADYRPSYRPEAAADAWQRQLDWLARHGVA